MRRSKIMLVHDLARASRVMVRESGHQTLMLRHRFNPPYLRRESSVAGAAGAGHQRCVDRLQNRVVRRGDDREMDFVIQLEIGRTLASGMVARHALVEALHLLEVSIGHALGGEFAGVALDSRDGLEQLLNVVDRKIAYARSATGQEVDKPLGREELDGFTDRRARNLERRGEIGVMQTLPHGQVPFDDHVPQTLDDRFVERLGTFDYGDGPSRATSRRRLVDEFTQHRLVLLGPFRILPRGAQLIIILHTECKK
jgi:hypothetical protein